MDFAYLGSVLLLVFGFGFVIFWHELGHFLAAKWAGVKVEQFAVGFGNAMFSWRKGLGIRAGSSNTELEKKLRDHIAQQRKATAPPGIDYEAEPTQEQFDTAAAELGLGETEYRLNWIPLGGYVKMLGQDDMNPNAQSDSPRAYNKKPIPKRMVIVSAGVIMNIILAILLFTILFRVGFDVPPALVGMVAPGSPAQQAGVQVGDRIMVLDGNYQHDFTKLSMNTALLQEGQAVPLIVKGPDGKQRELTITPRKESDDSSGFLRLGVGPAVELQGPDPKKVPKDWDKVQDLLPADVFAVRPGDVITAINGQPVDIKEFYKLDEALQKSYGKEVALTVRGVDGQMRQVPISARFATPYSHSEVNFAGLVPRATVVTLVESSSARGKLLPGDIILSITFNPSNDTFDNLSPHELREKLSIASKNGSTVNVAVLRNGQTMTVTGLSAQTRIDDAGNKGLGIGPGYDADHAIVGRVLADTAAARAKLPAGATLVSIDGQPVQTWFDVHRILRSIEGPKSVKVTARGGDGEHVYDLEVGQTELSEITSIRYVSLTMDALREYSEPRKTTNPILAARWGIEETRDLTLQFYLTLRRMVQGSVPASGAMGPIGIFHQGSKIAYRGTDWLIWFLAMISANLAVVNFLPIPIVDGGLFVFLILEKIMGKPLSPRAQSIAQIVGLALIASVFLFVTYHDITRLIF